MARHKLYCVLAAVGIISASGAEAPPGAKDPARARLAELDARGEGDTLVRAGALDVIVDPIFREKSFPKPEICAFAEKAVAIRQRLAPETLEAARSYSRLANCLYRNGVWDRTKTYIDLSFD